MVAVLLIGMAIGVVAGYALEPVVSALSRTIARHNLKRAFENAGPPIVMPVDPSPEKVVKPQGVFSDCGVCWYMSDFDLLMAIAKCGACGRSGSHLLPEIKAQRGGIKYGTPKEDL